MEMELKNNASTVTVTSDPRAGVWPAYYLAEANPDGPGRLAYWQYAIALVRCHQVPRNVGHSRKSYPATVPLSGGYEVVTDHRIFRHPSPHLQLRFRIHPQFRF